MTMQRYRNRSGRSGVTGYELGDGRILVRFTDGAIYEYTDQASGAEHVRQMSQLAEAGLGLATYISRHVRDAYGRRLN
jgi:hypothetical protein